MAGRFRRCFNHPTAGFQQGKTAEGAMKHRQGFAGAGLLITGSGREKTTPLPDCRIGARADICRSVLQHVPDLYRIGDTDT